MSKITSIKQQKDKNRVNIYLDGKFGFGIDLENFVKLGLRVEQELTREDIDRITNKAENQKIFDKILRFAMTRPRSSKEIQDWFRRKRVDESLWQDLKLKLQNYNLLDDENFARWWVEQRQQFRPRTKTVLKSELGLKGISKDIIRMVLEDTEIDELHIAKKALEKNNNKWLRLESRLKKKKMMEFLARKGFSWEVIKDIVNLQIDDEGIE